MQAHTYNTHPHAHTYSIVIQNITKSLITLDITAYIYPCIYLNYRQLYIYICSYQLKQAKVYTQMAFMGRQASSRYLAACQPYM